MRTVLLTLPLAFALATGAQAHDDGYGPWVRHVHGPGLGTVGGALAGGLVGRAIAGRHDNTLAILGGAALGVAVGSVRAGPRPRTGAGPHAQARISDRPRALAEVHQRLALHERHRLEHRRLEAVAAAPAEIDAADVVRVQRLLLALGHDPGPVDGILGPKTRAGVLAFEAARGLPRTGRVTPTLVERMKAAF
jgi:hypothetical protein